MTTVPGSLNPLVPAGAGGTVRRHGFALLATVAALATASSSAQAQTFEEHRHTVPAPYAGKYEARIGGSAESDDRLRLDIGASVDVFTIGDSTTFGVRDRSETSRLSLGADFFTWSRLRVEPSFKFPVEDVDYYFGVHAALRLTRVGGTPPLINELRLRIAHISAHTVDGDTTIRDSGWAPSVYSREFIDVLAGSDGARMGRILGIAPVSLRPYVGVLWVFHNIPAVAGRATPYAGLDVEAPLGSSLPLTARLGYEARVSTEVDPAELEHLARVGLKIGRPGSNGVVLEAGLYSGQSPYGQHVGERESLTFVGFAIEF